MIPKVLTKNMIPKELTNNGDFSFSVTPTIHVTIKCPPTEAICAVCGRPISELRPFGGPDDLRWADHTGDFLVAKPRGYGYYDEEADRALEEARKAGVKGEDLEPWLIAKYGKEKGERFCLATEFPWYYDWSLECRDCIDLNDDECSEKLGQR